MNRSFGFKYRATYRKPVLILYSYKPMNRSLGSKYRATNRKPVLTFQEALSLLILANHKI